MEPPRRQEIARRKHDDESQEVDGWLVREEVIRLYTVSENRNISVSFVQVSIRVPFYRRHSTSKHSLICVNEQP